MNTKQRETATLLKVCFNRGAEIVKSGAPTRPGHNGRKSLYVNQRANTDRMKLRLKQYQLSVPRSCQKRRSEYVNRLGGRGCE